MATPSHCKRSQLPNSRSIVVHALLLTLSQVSLAEVRVSDGCLSTQTGAHTALTAAERHLSPRLSAKSVNDVQLHTFSHTFLSSRLLQATLLGVFSFIMSLNIAYLLIGVGSYDFESGNTPSPYRTHSNAVFSTRIAVIALLVSFIAFMRCDPVSKEEEVPAACTTHLEPAHKHSCCFTHVGM